LGGLEAVSKPSIGFKDQSSLCELRRTGKAAARVKPEEYSSCAGWVKRSATRPTLLFLFSYTGCTNMFRLAVQLAVNRVDTAIRVQVQTATAM